MTFDVAKMIAELTTKKLSETTVVFRMPGWRVDVYSIMAKNHGLPPTAEIVYTAEAPRTGLLF
jgi:hypothetical protein